MSTKKIRVAVNGYGVIGKRIADAVVAQDDMELVGIADVVNDWRIRVGDYRVIYRIEPPDVVLVVKIGHRREVYEE